jgi:signal peptidase I
VTPAPSFTEQLANLPITYIVYGAVIATILRLALVRISHNTARSLSEILESFVIAAVLVYMLIRPFVVQAYFIPSPSMVPTLLGNHGIGDRILVNKFIYRMSRPNHDDIVVFIPPPNATEDTVDDGTGAPINFIKRMIAGPGDVIVVKAGRILINGKEYSHDDLRQKLADAGKLGGDTTDDQLADYHIKFTNDGVLLNGVPLPNSEVASLLTDQPTLPVKVIPGETIVNSKVLDEPFIAEDPDYDMRLWHGMPLKCDSSMCRLNGTPMSKSDYDQDLTWPLEPVPPNKYFMMGDNRNDSKDSTEWGPLDVSGIVGKAQFIFWPLNRMHPLH